MPIRSVLAALLAAALFASPLYAQKKDDAPQAPVFSEQVRIGFGEASKTYYKLGFWTPVEVMVRGGPKTVVGRMSLVAPDGDGIPAEVAREVQLDAGVAEPIRFLAPIGRADAGLRVRFDYQDQAGVAGQADRLLVESSDSYQSENLDAGRSLYLVLGSAVGLEDSILLEKTRWPESSTPEVVTLSTTRQLPTRWYGYQCVDLLVLTTSKPELYGQMSDAQRDALTEWVRMGGRVVISAGSASRPLLIPGGALHPFTPGKVDAFQDLNRSQGFDEYVEKSAPAARRKARLIASADQKMNVPFLREVQGQVVARDFDLPLIVRSVYGFGEVTFVAGDLDSRLFLDWTDAPQFHAALLDWPAAATAVKEGDNAGGGASMVGIRQSDISTQLRAGLDQFEGVRLVPFGLVAFLVVIYILLIGPGDYFFVKHFFKGRMEMTWITFPTIVLLVSVASYWLAGWMKGSRLRICQAAVIDVDLSHRNADGASDPLVRGTAWVNIFSPQTQRYHLSLAPVVPPDDTPTTRMLLSWLGLPEHGLGGMNSNEASMAGTAYSLDLEKNSIDRVPVQVWSTKAITGRWNQTGVELAEGKLTGAGDEISGGSITSHVDLKNCFLAFGNSYYAMGELKAGVAVPVPVRTRLDLFNRLRNTQLVSKDDKFSQTFESSPYNPRSLDVFETLETMMFFRRIEGRAYTSMQNDFQRFIDLSGHLQVGRAILVGRTEAPGANLLNDGQPIGDAEAKTWTCYRFVFPVTPSASEGQQR